jgi:ABC-type lipoprotein release transport system permease subunit
MRENFTRSSLQSLNPMGLLTAWVTALILAVVFGMYPAVRASRLSPMEAMR